MIRVEDLHMHFGGIRAVDGVTVSIAKGSITGLIGPNGAGKSTLFNVIAGLFPPTSGRVWLDGEEITGLPPQEVVRMSSESAAAFLGLSTHGVLATGRRADWVVLDAALHPRETWIGGERVEGSA